MKSLKRLKDAYVRFVEKQGFPIIVTVCVAVITATALWTGHEEEVWVAPTPPVSGDVSAAQLLQQSLRQASTATPAPTASTTQWMPPLDKIEILTAFSREHMVQSGITGIWAVHDAVDLAASKGSLVRSMADGTVTGHGKDALQGIWVKIEHPDGVSALYAGMALGGAFITGDEVRIGDIIGYAGSGLLAEGDMAPHLHLRTTQNGIPIDPISLWSGL